MPSAQKVISGKPLVTGGILRAPIGTALPVDESTALNVAFKALGYVSDDGVTLTPDRSTDKKRAWGGALIKVVQTDFGVTVKFTLVEANNVDAKKVAFGDANVTSVAATSTSGTKIAVAINKSTLPHATYILDMADGISRTRVSVPDGQITELGDIVYKDDEVTAYECTLDCYEDASGNCAYEYSNDGITTT